MAWANREGLAGRSIRDRGSSAQKAADVGTAIHTMIEAHAQGWDPIVAAGSQLTDLDEQGQAKVHKGFASYQRWARNSRIRIVATEIYAVDEEYQTGFCLDALGVEEADEGPALSLVDWKSSKGTYADHFIQVAAYTVFVERAVKRLLGTDCTLLGAHVLRVGGGTFKHVFWDRAALEKGWQVFTWCRALHAARPEIEGYVR